MTDQRADNAAACERFAQDTARHKMTVHHDDGLYRHLVFKEPGSSFYWYELITWPGTLVISGDMGSHTFRRDTDMFAFFRANPDRTEYRINTDYWAEKLQGGLASGRDSVKEWDRDLFVQAVTDHVERYLRDYNVKKRVGRELMTALHEQVLDVGVWDDASKERALADLEEFKFQRDPVYPGDPTALSFRFEEHWEWLDARRYSPHFLWCLHAIVTGIEDYDAAHDSAQVAS